MFILCIRNNSFRVALELYLRNMRASITDPEIMDKIIVSIKSSAKFHEFKLFFILTHFDVLDIRQLNDLIDTFLIIFHRSDHSRNPALSQYNPIKYALLIYRVCWKIEQKKIYSLITKCQIVNKYIR